MKQSDLVYLLLNEIGTASITLLIVSGLLFGIAFTYAHFWSIKKFVLQSPHFKRTIFILTFVRLIAFALALMMAAYPNYAGVRMILFFIGFMVGRISLMRMAKKELQSDYI